MNKMQVFYQEEAVAALKGAYEADIKRALEAKMKECSDKHITALKRAIKGVEEGIELFNEMKYPEAYEALNGAVVEIETVPLDT